jgi:hypothetical protein
MKDVEVPTTQLTRQAENDCEMKITVSGKRLQQKRFHGENEALTKMLQCYHDEIKLRFGVIFGFVGDEFKRTMAIKKTYASMVYVGDCDWP